MTGETIGAGTLQGRSRSPGALLTKNLQHGSLSAVSASPGVISEPRNTLDDEFGVPLQDELTQDLQE